MLFSGPIHHRVAKRWVRTAQIAMLVGAVGVVPVLLFGMPSAAPLSVPDVKPVDPKPDPHAQGGKPAKPGLDSAGVAARFVLVGNTPKPKPADESPANPGPPPPPPPPAVKYLGALIDATSRAALLVVDNKQKMLWVGDKVGNVELVSVEPGHVTIKENGIERTLDLAPKSGPLVTASAGPAAGAPPGMPSPGGGMNGMPQPNADGTDANELHNKAREVLDRLRTRSEGRTPQR